MQARGCCCQVKEVIVGCMIQVQECRPACKGLMGTANKVD